MRLSSSATLRMLFWEHRYLAWELGKREFLGKYNSIASGILWSILQPLFLLSIYTVAFGFILKIDWVGSQDTRVFALAVFGGLIIYSATVEVLNQAPFIITGKPNFIKKVIFPLEVIPLISVLLALFQAAISTLVWILVYTVIFSELHFIVLIFPLYLLIIMPFLLGISLIVSALSFYVKNIAQYGAIIGHALLFLTPVFYPISIIPTDLRILVIANPLTPIVSSFRELLLYQELPSVLFLGTYFLLSLIFLYGAYELFKRLRPGFADRV